MPRRDFYTLPEAAQLLEMAQRRLLERLESGEIEGERDQQSGRWKVSRQAVDELVSGEEAAEGPAEEPLELSAEMLRGLVDELGELHRQVGHLRSRLDRARRAEKEEGVRLQAELEQEREGHRRERERADKLQQEAGALREELESERQRVPKEAVRRAWLAWFAGRSRVRNLAPYSTYKRQMEVKFGYA